MKSVKTIYHAKILSILVASLLLIVACGPITIVRSPGQQDQNRSTQSNSTSDDRVVFFRNERLTEAEWQAYLDSGLLWDDYVASGRRNIDSQGGSPNTNSWLAQTGQKPTVTSYNIEAYRGPKGGGQILDECVNSSFCQGVLRAASSYTGVPFNEIVYFASVAVPRPNGEITEWNISPPSAGLLVCDVAMEHVSVAPASGDKTSYFHIAASAGGVYIRTQNPVHQVGGPGSFYNGRVFVTYVPSSVNSNNCSVGRNSLCYSCRGSTGNTHGLPTCYGKDILSRVTSVATQGSCPQY